MSTDQPQPRDPKHAQPDGPEKPRLAAEVELCGELKDSAFASPQFLVRRRGRFVQVPALLYRILEHADGEADLAGIAQAVSETLGRRVSPENVRHLVAGKLIPAGLVAGPEGTPSPAGRATSDGPGRSPLAVNLRLRMLSPRVIDPVTALLRYLYVPPVLLAILAIAAGAHAWLYLVHGIGPALRQAFYTPGLVFLLMVAMVGSAIFHEFGHAAALRYGGGRTRGMGVGFYVVYPAFYTDVTESYRLGRWARVRVDLGGFYFNLIVALAFVLISTLSHQEFLLLMVVLTDLEILHQFLPLGRLDGYWALADLTGIPDFFSQMGAFVRSTVPIWRGKGHRLAPLLWWAKLVFALYLLIVVPLLVLLLLLTIRGFPRLLVTAADSLVLQVGGFGAARGRGDVIGMANAAFQGLVLAFSTVGVTYTLVVMARRGLSLLWRWGRPTPRRRALAGLATTGAVGLVALLWLPQVAPLVVAAPPSAVRPIVRPIRADERDTVGDAFLSAGPTPAGPDEPTIAPTPARVAAAGVVGASVSVADARPAEATGPSPDEPGATPLLLAPATSVGPAPASATLVSHATAFVSETAASASGSAITRVPVSDTPPSTGSPSANLTTSTTATGDWSSPTGTPPADVDATPVPTTRTPTPAPAAAPASPPTPVAPSAPATETTAPSPTSGVSPSPPPATPPGGTAIVPTPSAETTASPTVGTSPTVPATPTISSPNPAASPTGPAATPASLTPIAVPSTPTPAVPSPAAGQMASPVTTAAGG